MNFPFSIPDYLEEAISDFLYALKNEEYCDCQATELHLALRDAVKFGEITEHQKQLVIETLTEEEARLNV